MFTTLRRHLWIVFILSLTACGTTPTDQKALAPTSIPLSMATENASRLATITPVETQTTTAISTPKTSSQDYFPNLWTKIPKEKIEFYPYDWVSDYAVAEDGSLWLIGGFGVIHIEKNYSKKTWYSMKNGLAHNFFTTVAISPNGEVWIGGVNNALYRFNNGQWINEGERLAAPVDDRTGWLCYSQDIVGIDFAEDGSVWVMNGGIELYTQIYGQWLNFPFPKDILPEAGGGACPVGLRVKSHTNITIMLNGCCGSGPKGYHFDGKDWGSGADYTEVKSLLDERHNSGLYTIKTWSSLHDAGFSDWPFNIDLVLSPELHWDRYNKFRITPDKVGLVEAHEDYSSTSNAPEHNSTWNLKPMIIADDGKFGDCTFHKTYVVAANCLGLYQSLPGYEEKPVYEKLQADGTKIYVTSHTVKKVGNEFTKGFLFDSIEINAAIVDDDGYIWVFSQGNGLLRLAPNIFDDYQELIRD